MKHLKQEPIPSEFREERDLKRQIGEHHIPFFVISADGLLRPSESYLADKIDRR